MTETSACRPSRCRCRQCKRFVGCQDNMNECSKCHNGIVVPGFDFSTIIEFCQKCEDIYEDERKYEASHWLH